MLKTIMKNAVKSFKEEYATIRAEDKRVAYLMKIEKKFKATYKVDVDVRYVDAKHKNSMVRKGVRGYYRRSNDRVVVFINKDLKANTITLLHELTHAYQSAYMTDMYTTSTKDLKSGKVSYKDAWHERHARHTADILALGYIGMPIDNSMDYAIAA